MIEAEALLRALMIYSNLGIAGGYCCAAAFAFPGINPVVWRKLHIEYKQTRISAFFFLVSCAATHIELYLHAMEGGITLEDMTSVHMVVIHVIQVFSVFGFLLGILREVLRPEQTSVQSEEIT